MDYYHTGNSHEEWFSLDRVVLEPLEWPGNLNKTIDESQLGEYLFEVRERGEREVAVLARIQFRVWRVEDDGRGAAWEPDIFGVAAFSES